MIKYGTLNICIRRYQKSFIFAEIEIEEKEIPGQAI